MKWSGGPEGARWMTHHLLSSLSLSLTLSLIHSLSLSLTLSLSHNTYTVQPFSWDVSQSNSSSTLSVIGPDRFLYFLFIVGHPLSHASTSHISLSLLRRPISLHLSCLSTFDIDANVFITFGVYTGLGQHWKGSLRGRCSGRYISNMYFPVGATQGHATSSDRVSPQVQRLISISPSHQERGRCERFL